MVGKDPPTDPNCRYQLHHRHYNRRILPPPRILRPQRCPPDLPHPHAPSHLLRRHLPFHSRRLYPPHLRSCRNSPIQPLTYQYPHERRPPHLSRSCKRRSRYPSGNRLLRSLPLSQQHQNHHRRPALSAVEGQMVYLSYPTTIDHPTFGLRRPCPFQHRGLLSFKRRCWRGG